MTASVKHDIEMLLTAFPRQFTSRQLEEYFGWAPSRVRQTIVYGKQIDVLRVIAEPKIYGPNESRRVDLCIYENIRWRKEWMTKAWRSHGTLASEGQRTG